MIRRCLVAVTLSWGAAVAVIVSLDAGQQPSALASGAFTGTGQTVTRLSDGRALVAGGQGSSGPVDTVTLFDPTTQATTILPARFQEPRAGHSATILSDGTIVFVGGIGA